MYSSKSRILLGTILAGTCSMGIALNYSRAATPPAAAQTKKSPAKPAQQTGGQPAASGKMGQELFVAVDHRDVAGVKALLKQGADPNSHNFLGFSPLDIAAASFQPEMMETLLEAGAKVDDASPVGTALTFAAQSGDVPGMKLLIARGANINPSRVDGITVLMLTARAGEAEMVSELLRLKANANATDSDGATALIYAAREGKKEAAQALLSAGATIDRADTHGWTPLMYAAVNGHTEMVRFLLENHANPNARDAKGRTAIALVAAYNDAPDVIRALKAGGADVQLKDKADRSAYNVAVARAHTGSAELLGTPGATPAAMPMVTLNSAARASLKAVQSSMKMFDQRTGCVSCHQDGLGRIAAASARQHGFQIDAQVQQTQTQRTEGMLAALKPLHQAALKDPKAMLQVPLVEIQELTPGYTWMMAGMAAQKQKANEATAAAAMVLARQQMPDGHWQFGVPRAPMQSSFFTTTALAVQSLRAYGPHSHGQEIEERIQRAKSWLLKTAPQNNEDRAFRLMGLKWAGATAEERRETADALRAEQRPDGGWSQLPTLRSDAYATGQALYALHIAGDVAATDPIYKAGVQYLLRTQDADGTWFVNKRAMPLNNYFDTGFAHGQSQYASFNGTCWAMMALLEAGDKPTR